MMEIFMGKDGKPSGRRIIGFLLIVWGGVLLTISSLQPLIEGVTVWDVVMRLGPGVILALVGAYFWGLITAQNIKEWTGNVSKNN
jgi:hypothetical protein